ncbi:MAG: triose-phosphate isomerase [Actinobacteria bacterium]|nr:MAG: triose-phosphate isomerase [Actinomycetota bacterium]
MRTPLIAGNWKMHKTAGEAVVLVQNLAKEIYDVRDVEVAVCPPFTALKSVSTVIELDKLNVKLGAQDVFWQMEGAYTGEISPSMLADLAVEYVIVGHSERRQHFAETNETVNKKVAAVVQNEMKPIMCVGESLEQREAEETNAFVREQVIEGLLGIKEDQVTGLVVAYEPIWAIGTGRSATPEMANDVCRHIRAVLGSIFTPELGRQIRILYGGSVNEGNIGMFMQEPDIDGALVGGASLDAVKFSGIVKFDEQRVG